MCARPSWSSPPAARAAMTAVTTIGADDRLTVARAVFVACVQKRRQKAAAYPSQRHMPPREYHKRAAVVTMNCGEEDAVVSDGYRTPPPPSSHTPTVLVGTPVIPRGTARLSGSVGPSRATSSPRSLCDALDDDATLCVLHSAALVTNSGTSFSGGSVRGLALHRKAMESSRATANLAATCRRIRNVYCTNGAALRMELMARAVTQITPPLVGRDGIAVPYPFKMQCERESISAAQLALLKDACGARALHCATNCCARRRRLVAQRACAFASPLAANSNGSGVLVAPVHPRAIVAAASSFDGLRGFVVLGGNGTSSSSGHRLARVRHTAPRSMRAPSPLSFVASATATTTSTSSFACATPSRQLELERVPHCMRASRCGRMVAIVDEPSSSPSGATVAQSRVCFFPPMRSGRAPTMITVPSPSTAVECGAVNAQDLWWVSDAQLAIVWSTLFVWRTGHAYDDTDDNEFVHGPVSEHMEPRSAYVVPPGCCYVVALYDAMCGDDGDRLLELNECSSPQPGRVHTASATARGDEALLYVLQRPLGARNSQMRVHTASLPRAVLHRVDVADEAVCDIPIPIWEARVALSHSAVALSPQGDAAIVVSESTHGVFVDLYVRLREAHFVRTFREDVARYLGGGNNVGANWSDVSPPYTICFSQCGRYAIVTAAAGRRRNATSPMVVLDTALRHEREGVSVVPLGEGCQLSVRALQWTSRGVWIQTESRGTVAATDTVSPLLHRAVHCIAILTPDRSSSSPLDAAS